jgi:hypothetical protein
MADVTCHVFGAFLLESVLKNPFLFSQNVWNALSGAFSDVRERRLRARRVVLKRSLSQNSGEFLTFLMKIGSEDGSIVLKRDDIFLEIQTALAGDSKAIYTQAYSNLPNGIEKNYGFLYYNKYFQYYSLQNLLTVYGKPDQIYFVLDTGIANMGLGIDLYLLSIEYQTKGWMAVFDMPLRQRENIFLGCPSEAFVNLRIWSPANKPQDAFVGGFGGDDTSYLFTIEEATSMTLEEFYQKFKDPTTACLETPADIHK